MKKQLFKRLLAFSIAVFSFCFGQLNSYLLKGWSLSAPPVVAKNDATVIGKNL